MKWLFSSKNGVKVFSIYGIGDGTDATPYLAVGGKQADAYRDGIQKFLEGNNNGNIRDRTSVNRRIESLLIRQGETSNNLSNFGNRGTKTKDGEVYNGKRGSNRGRTDSSGTENSGKVSFSLQDKYWHTDLNRTQIKEVEKELRQIGNPESTRITDTANWYKGRLDGEDLFVIYSTEDVSNPTILYEARGKNAKLEQNILMDLLEDVENGTSINGESSFAQRVSKGDWMQDVNGGTHNLSSLGARADNKDAGVLQRQSQRNGSPAFRNVIENLFKRQERGGSINESKNFSLKEGKLTKKERELIGDIEDAISGKKGSYERLLKYVKEV